MAKAFSGAAETEFVETTIGAMLLDPRTVMPNFVSGFTSEYEHLASLVILPEEILHMFSNTDLAGITTPKILEVLNADLNARHVNRQLTKSEVNFQPIPAEMADSWWNLFSSAEQLSAEQFAGLLKNGIPSSYLTGLDAVVNRPVEKP